MNPEDGPRPAVRPGWSPERSAVTAYIHRDTRAAWLDVAGPLSPLVGPQRLLTQMRRAHRRIPRGIDVVGVDLTRIDEVAIDLAVLLSLESRMLGLRKIQLAVVLRHGTGAAHAAHPMLEQLHIWRVGDERLVDLSTSAARARLGTHGWEPLV